MQLLDAWLQSRCPVAGLPSWQGLVMLLGYMAVLAALGAILPARFIQGTKLADGTSITYNCNGLRVLVALLLGLALGVGTGLVSPTAVADRGGELFATTLLFAFLVSVALYLGGRRSASKTASLRPHSTGGVLLDWWLGVQLNPSFLGLDLKFFWLRPAMMGWLLINLSVAAKQLQQRGAVSLPMALYQTFTAVYVADYFWYEEYMTSTWDIIAENFGFMLVFGDLVFIPFTFSIQAWWLLQHEVELSWRGAAVMVVIFAIGYAVFRGANKQKHIFKHDPTALIWGQTPKLVGGRLLVSGYWGVARHCNYLGDLLLALSYSLPCGSSAFIPYFYPTYLLLLLLWRERRDEARCRKKYREIWTEYCLLVPWRICPYLY